MARCSADYREVRVAQAIIENARRVLLVADHTKFGCNPMVRLGRLSDIDVFFTDVPPPENIVRILNEANVELHVVDPTASRVVESGIARVSAASVLAARLLKSPQWPPNGDSLPSLCEALDGLLYLPIMNG